MEHSQGQRVIPLNNSTPTETAVATTPEYQDLPCFLIERINNESLLVFALKDTFNPNRKVTVLDLKKIHDCLNNQRGHFQMFLTLEKNENDRYQEQDILLNPADISSIEPAGMIRYHARSGLLEEIS